MKTPSGQSAASDRYADQQKVEHPMYDIKVHMLRIGDIVICSNPIELYAGCGLQMKTRSKALQTFVVQLTGSGSYLSTAIAVKGGHCSAVPQSNEVGTEGGQILVERTVQTINKLW
ncbi:MAG: hypothetical protein M9904_12310 [Chitinophagaceae bacterium]|nr:hypothetical protein [Chitinophagaceae bacterium]